jgi:mycothiol synthase
MEWALDRVRAFPDVTEIWTSAGAEHTDALRFLDTYGFEHVRSWFRMINHSPAAIADPAWPKGIELRAHEGATAVDAIVRAYNGSFIDHFNFHPTDAQTVEADFLRDPNADPSLWFFAYDGDDLAGFCLTWLSGESKDRGRLGPIGTMRSHRRIGLGRALLRHGVRALSDRGAKKVSLGVDTENPSGAVQLYQSDGFEVQLEGRSFKRSLA